METDPSQTVRAMAEELGVNFHEVVQGGIALTSPPCKKKTDQRSNGKSPVCLSNELRNGCCKGGVIKKYKNLTVNAILIIRKEMREHVPSTMHVFRGEKYRLLLRGGPTHR